MVPKKEHCFDHKRPITKFQTLIDKYDRNVGEDDLSSIDEILALHDLSMDPPAGTLKQFKARSLKNYENRALHHHVFNFDLLSELQEFIGMDEVDRVQKGLHQVVMWACRGVT